MAFAYNLSGAGPLTVTAHGDLSATGNGSGSYLSLTGTNTFTGGLTVTSGLVQADIGLGAAGNLVALNGGGLVGVTTSAVAQPVALGAAGGALRVYSGATLTVGQPVTGPGGLTKTASGTLALTGANTFGGDTRVAAGTLALGNANALAGSTLNLAAFDAGSVSFGLAGGNTYNLGGLAGGRNLALGANSLAVGANGASTAYAGALSGTGGLTKAGGGTLTLSGTNTYTGATTVNGGTLAVASGSVGSSAADLTVNAAATLSAGAVSSNNTAVGGSSHGTFTQTGGTHNASSGLSVGYNSGVSGTYTLIDGQLNTPFLAVGQYGSGTFAQSGGTHTVTNSLRLGVRSGGSGDYALSGGQLMTAGTIVGGSGVGTFTQTGGSHAVGTDLTVGQSAAGGSYALSDGLLTAGNTAVGSTGVGTFTQTGGVHSTGTLTLGASSGTGTYLLRGGTLQANAVVQGNGTSTFAFDGGTLRAAGGINLFQGPSAVPVLLRVGGGTIDSNGREVAISRAILTDPLVGGVPDGGLTKTGAGQLDLFGVNTYTGGTTVRAGTLYVNTESNLGAAGGPVTVLGSGRLVIGGTAFTTGRGLDLGVSTLTPAAGGTITFNGAAISGGTLSGGGFVTPAGLGSTFVGVTTAPSATLTLGGADGVTNSTLGGITTVLAATPGPALYDSTIPASGRVTLNSTGRLGMSGLVSYGQVTLADGTGTSPATRTTLTNTCTSDLYFGGGSRTLVGIPANAGNQYAAVNLGSKQAVVDGGLFVNNGLVGNGTVVADFGSLVKGSGTFLTPPVTQNGGRYTPGNSPGRGTTGSALFNGGGTFQFQINNAAGAAGPTPDANNGGAVVGQPDADRRGHLRIGRQLQPQSAV